jgi:hypothetical protein
MRYLLSFAFLFILAASALAGTIQPPLDEMIAQSSDKIGVIVALADRVDNAILDQQLRSRHVTLAERHYEVVTALRNKATDTQSDILSHLHRLVAGNEVEHVRNFWIANMIGFKGTPEAIREIADLPGVDKIYFDFPVETIAPIIDPDYKPPVITSHPDGLQVIHAPEVWAMGFTGYGRLVSNIDTGVDGTHPALSARWRGNNGHPAGECWFDPVYGYSTPTDHGQHGTHTMGTICGRSTTTADTVGVAINAQWIAAGSVDYGGTTSDIIASFQFIADPDGDPGTIDDVPDAVGNSWGYSPFFHGVPHCDPTFWAAIDGCENAGVVVIFSAGNEGDYGSNSLRTPADRATTYFNAFSVGAIDGHTPGYPICSFSSLGPCSCASGDLAIKPECVAPGYNVYSSIPGGSYAGNWSGTSMASPHITGSVAILRQANPNLDVNTIKDILLQSCVDLGPSGEDNTYGHGYLDLRVAVQLAMTGFGFVHGFVRNSENNSFLPATISVVGGVQRTTANALGYYILALPADTSYTLQASYNGYYPSQDTVTIVVNDTASLNFYLAPIPPPEIDYDPASFIKSASIGQVVRDTLNIYNLAGGPLDFTLDAVTDNRMGAPINPDLPPVAQRDPEPIGHTPVEAAKPDDGNQPIYPPSILNHGGPDAFGYEWIDSDDFGGPTYGWVDISGVGTPLNFTLDDQFIGPVDMGMNFRFYGSTYSSIYICSNGFLSFSGDTAAFGNRAIPTAAQPNNFIAPLWDDLSPQRHGSVYYYHDAVNNRFIVSYSNIEFFSRGGDLYFEVILYPGGRIFFEYGTIDGGTRGLAELTIGMENSTGTDGLQVTFDALYLHSDMAILFRPPAHWLGLSLRNGSIMPGNDTSAVVTFDATDLEEGSYTGHLELNSNDPDEGSIAIPVSFTVGGAGTPNIVQTPSSLSDTLYQGDTSTLVLKARNTGNGTLILSFSDSSTWISETLGPFNIVPGDSVMEAINLNASGLAPGTHQSAVMTTSNDPDTPSIRTPVTLLVLASPLPDIDLIGASFTDTVQTNGSVRDTFYIANLGTDILYYGLHDNRAWISAAPDSGNVPISQRDTVVVTLDASTLAPGNYSGQITLNSNDPDESLFTLPVNLLVTEAGGCAYVIGDVNDNGVFNGLDVTYGVAFFKGGPPPSYSCECPPYGTWFVAGDVNASCSFNGLDITYMVAFFKGGPGPQPCPDCLPQLLLAPRAGQSQGVGAAVQSAGDR